MMLISALELHSNVLEAVHRDAFWLLVFILCLICRMLVTSPAPCECIPFSEAGSAMNRVFLVALITGHSSGFFKCSV